MGKSSRVRLWDRACQCKCVPLRVNIASKRIARLIFFRFRIRFRNVFIFNSKVGYLNKKEGKDWINCRDRFSKLIEFHRARSIIFTRIYFRIKFDSFELNYHLFYNYSFSYRGSLLSFPFLFLMFREPFPTTMIYSARRIDQAKLKALKSNQVAEVRTTNPWISSHGGSIFVQIADDFSLRFRSNPTR